jgi:hypothetical protein
MNCGKDISNDGRVPIITPRAKRLEAVKLGKLGEQIRRPGLKLARVFA